MESNSLLKIAHNNLESLSKLRFKEKVKKSLYKVKRWLTLPSCWLFVIPLTIIAYATTFINIGLPIVFHFSEGQIYFYIEKWLNFIIPLFSLIIIISIFLIQSIEKKYSDDELYSVVFRESKFYPILYFSLSIIAIMLFLFFKPDFINENIAIKITILSLYFFIGDILAIGYLFYKAYKFLYLDYLIKLYLNDIRFFFENEILEEAITRLSYVLYNQKMDDEGFTQNYFGSSIINRREISLSLPERKIIRDIKVDGLISWLKEFQPVTYRPVYIDMVIPDRFKLFWIQNEENIVFPYKKFFRLDDYIIEKSELEKVKEKLKERLDKSVLEDNVISLEGVLNNYQNIYDFFTQLTSRYSLNTIPQIQSLFFVGRGWEALASLDRHIIIAFSKAVTNKSLEASKKIITFVDRLIVLSIQTKNQDIFLQYKFTFQIFYKDMLSSEEIRTHIMTWLSIRLRELLSVYIKLEIEKESDEKNINILKRIRMELFIILNQLLRRSLENGDIRSFSKLIRELNQIRVYA